MIPNADCKTTTETKKKLQKVPNKSETINNIKLNRRGIIKKTTWKDVAPYPVYRLLYSSVKIQGFF